MVQQNMLLDIKYKKLLDMNIKRYSYHADTNTSKIKVNSWSFKSLTKKKKERNNMCFFKC